MVYFATTQNENSAVYFDIHTALRGQNEVCFSGIIGDGFYEGEVLVSMGHRDSVTFLDAWTGSSDFNEFKERIDIGVIKSSLLTALKQHPFPCGKN